MGNAFLDSGAREASVVAKLDDSTKKHVKELNATIRIARLAEQRAIEKLNAFKSAGKQIPNCELMDGTVTTDAELIRADINAATTLKVKMVSREIDLAYIQAGVPKPAEVIEAKMVGAGQLVGEKLGKVTHAPFQAIMSFGRGFRKETKQEIQTIRDVNLNL
jgi:hypothetical protein